MNCGGTGYLSLHPERVCGSCPECVQVDCEACGETAYLEPDGCECCGYVNGCLDALAIALGEIAGES